LAQGIWVQEDPPKSLQVAPYCHPSSVASTKMADVEAQQYAPMAEGGSVKDACREVRMGFIRKVYSILTVQLLVTVAIAGYIGQMPVQWFADNMWLLQLSLVGTIVVTCIIMCCPDVCRRYPSNYVVLFGFTACEAVLVGVVSAQYTAGVVCFCAGVTTVIFVGMTVYAWTTKSDFTGMGPYLLVALLALFTLGCAFSLLSLFGINLAPLKMFYAAAGVLIFTCFIVYDTQLIIGAYQGHKLEFGIDDYVFAALSLYLDIINLFLDLLRLFGSSND